MNTDVKVGVILPTGSNQWTDARELIELGRRAETLGYRSLLVNDSLLNPRIEPLTLLAALAPVTERVTLGTAALMPFLRRPIQAAQQLASIDRLSGGRLAVTVGAGFPGRFGRPLYDMSELPWERRFKRLDETVELWRRLWTADGPVSFHGEIFDFDDVPVQTAPFRPGGPPIWLGGATPAALARTGRMYDGWLPYPPDANDYRTGLADVRAEAEAAGRDPAAITPALFVSVAITDDEAQGEAVLEDYAQANYGVPLEQLRSIQCLVAGPPEHVRAYLERYVAAGARHLAVRIAAPDVKGQHEQLELIGQLLLSGNEK
jgi:alkanesulfonate monooxygenase SsuD/methylene tetrahydromethanopterin reductase-like flavin-dependent oxidoreductase (luciferase family)